MVVVQEVMVLYVTGEVLGSEIFPHQIVYILQMVHYTKDSANPPNLTYQDTMEL